MFVEREEISCMHLVASQGEIAFGGAAAQIKNFTAERGTPRLVSFAKASNSISDGSFHAVEKNQAAENSDADHHDRGDKDGSWRLTFAGQSPA